MISLGPFVTCFFTTMILTAYLYLISHISLNIFKFGTKTIFAISTIIIMRMLIPVNLPFTYTIFPKEIMNPIGNLIYAPIGKLYVNEILLFIWIIGIAILTVRYIRKRILTRMYLNQYILSDEELERYHLQSFLESSSVKHLAVTVLPGNQMPAIFGVFRPIIILPENFYTCTNLEYILSHEIQHYRNHHLLIKFMIDLLVIIHWWNPFVYCFRKLFNTVLEISNDCAVAKNMSAKNKLHYALSLLNISKKEPCSLNYDFALANKSSLENRICLLSEDTKIPKKRMFKTAFAHLLFIGVLLLITLFIVPESLFEEEFEKACAEEGAVAITSENAYFVKTQNGYKLYVNHEYWVTLDKIKDDFKELTVYEN